MNHSFFQNVLARATFAPGEMQKVDCFRSEHLLVGLNCLARGQSQRQHIHADADKFYLVVQGQARITVAGATHEAGPGALVWAPAGSSHGIDAALEDTVVVVAMAPPPRH